MNPRHTARGQEEALTISDRKGCLEGLGTTFKVARASALVKDIFTCRALIPLCPDLWPGPEVRLQPLLQPRQRTEIRQHLACENSLNGAPADSCLTLDAAHRRRPLGIQRLQQPQHERSRIDGTCWGVLSQPSGRPLTTRDVLARGGISSGPRHAPSLGQRPDSRIVGGDNYSRSSGSYKTHLADWETSCRSTLSSEALS